MENKKVEELEPFTAEEEYAEYENDMQSQLKKDLEEASA
jgi:CHASE3 domain sensor protein